MGTGSDDDKTWAELVDTFHDEPAPDEGTQRWPAAENVDPDDTRADDDDLADPYHTASHEVSDLPVGDLPVGAQAESVEPFGTQRPDLDDVDQRDDGDHFVPPNPPPIPRGDRITRWAWTGMVAPPCALLLSSIAAWSPPDELMMLLIGGFIAGFGTLVARMRGRNPHDPDNGAVV